MIEYEVPESVARDYLGGDQWREMLLRQVGLPVDGGLIVEPSEFVAENAWVYEVWDVDDDYGMGCPVAAILVRLDPDACPGHIVRRLESFPLLTYWERVTCSGPCPDRIEA